MAENELRISIRETFAKMRHVQRAKRVIQKGGWRKGAFQDLSSYFPVVDCNHCQVGAMWVADTNFSGSVASDQNSVERWANTLGFSNTDSAYDWNDDPDRTVEDVIANMDSRIRVYRGMIRREIERRVCRFLGRAT